MKKHIADFFRRGIISCGLGPLVLAVLYLITAHYSGFETLSVSEVCTGIVSLTAVRSDRWHSDRLR